MFHTLCLTINKYTIEYLSDYGIDRKRGWFVTYDGSVVVQFAPSALSAVWQAHSAIRSIKEYNRTAPPRKE